MTPKQLTPRKKITLEYKPKMQRYKNKIYFYDRGPIYTVWMNMRNRCNNVRSRNYKDYGGRGIKVDSSWNSFEVFRNDMESLYEKGLTLDRIDNNGNYCKENCRWATKKQQANNTRYNRWITAFNKTQTITQWAKDVGIKRLTLRNRIMSGWAAEKAIATPTRNHKQYTNYA